MEQWRGRIFMLQAYRFLRGQETEGSIPDWCMKFCEANASAYAERVLRSPRNCAWNKFFLIKKCVSQSTNCEKNAAWDCSPKPRYSETSPEISTRSPIYPSTGGGSSLLSCHLVDCSFKAVEQIYPIGGLYATHLILLGIPSTHFNTAATRQPWTAHCNRRLSLDVRLLTFSFDTANALRACGEWARR